MSTRMVILGFMRSRPQYGYEIKQMIEHVMGDWTNIAFGSIYYALKKLTEEGFIEKVGTEQQGDRPSRTVYQITNAGQEEFMRLLREVWSNLERQTFEIDIGLSFISALSMDEIKKYLRERLAHLEEIIKYLDAHQVEELADEHVPSLLASTIFDHSRVHFNAELDWTRTLLQNVEQGTFNEEIEWMRGTLESEWTAHSD